MVSRTEEARVAIQLTGAIEEIRWLIEAETVDATASSRRPSGPGDRYDSTVVSEDIRLRGMEAGDYAGAMSIARSLPEWFNDQGIEQMSHDLRIQHGAVAEANGRIVGFVTWCVHDGIGEIAWIGVGPDLHRKGVGTSLLAFAEIALRDLGVVEVEVETLGDSVAYEPYERTRAFYRDSGFRDHERMVTDNPGMPESLTLRKCLVPPAGM